MTNGEFVAYYRVSTAKQSTSGLGLEAQQEAVRGYLNGGKWRMVDEVTEVDPESGMIDPLWRVPYLSAGSTRPL